MRFVPPGTSVSTTPLNPNLQEADSRFCHRNCCIVEGGITSPECLHRKAEERRYAVFRLAKIGGLFLDKLENEAGSHLSKKYDPTLKRFL